VTVEELLEAVRNITEENVKKLKLESWISIELGRIVNRKKYWWRKAPLAFTSEANTATYDLAKKGAADFLQFATPLYEFQNVTKVAELPFVSDNVSILQMVRDTSTGVPTLMTIEPGTVRTLRLSPVPNSVRSYSAIYYRGAIVKFKSPGNSEIPLIPDSFHYVLLQSLERRAFFYLYGQKDPRAVVAAQAEQQALADLDDYKAPSTLVAVEWRSSDESSFVQSTR